MADNRSLKKGGEGVVARKRYLDPPAVGQEFAVVTFLMKEGVVPLNDAVQSYGIGKVSGTYPTPERAKERAEEVVREAPDALGVAVVVPVGQFFTLAKNGLEEGDPGVDTLPLEEESDASLFEQETQKVVSDLLEASDRKKRADMKAILARKEKMSRVKEMPEEEPDTEIERLLKDYFCAFTCRSFVTQQTKLLWDAVSNASKRLERMRDAVRKDPSLLAEARQQYLTVKEETGGGAPPDFEAFLGFEGTLMDEKDAECLRNVLDLATRRGTGVGGDKAL